MCGCAGWSAPLLFTYDKNRFSHDVAHCQIDRSYLCRIRWKRVCCIQFYGEKKNKNKKQNKNKTKKNCWLTIVGGHFFALTPSIYVRNGTMRLFVKRSESILKSPSSYSIIIIAETSYIARSAHMSNLRISWLKSSENHHNFWTVQDSLMKYHWWACLINLCLIDKNENCCISSFLVMCP